MGKKRFTVLLVDDEPDVLELLKETLSDEHNVLTATSGWTALDLLRAQVVDLLITDQRMPNITGVQLAERAHVDHPHLPIIILTAYTDPPDLIAAINKGQVYRFITKPWDVPHLLQTVEEALEGVRLRRENAQLLQNAQRRLNALKVMLEVCVAASSQTSYGEVVDTVTTFLESVVPLDASATLVRAEPDRPANLTLRLRADVADEELEKLKDETIERHRALADDVLPENQVLVRFTGRRPGARAPTGPGGAHGAAKPAAKLQSRLFIPLRAEGRFAGVLAIAAHADEAFSDDDATILDLLANHAGELIRGLRTKIEADRKLMNRMVEGMADGLIMTDSSGEVVVANGAAHELLGIPPDVNITSKHVSEKLGISGFELVRGWERGGGRAVADDVETESRVLRSVVSPVTDADGRLSGVVVVLHDVTAERLLERRKEDFFADVSHELRTPLTAVAGALDLVLMKPDQLSEQQRHYLALAKSASSRLHSTIDDLLDIARAARLGLELDLQQGSLVDVVMEAVGRFEPSFAVSEVKVKVNKPAGPVNVVMDRARIGQVLNNLLANALKFTPAGKAIEIDVLEMADVSGAAGFSVWNEGAHIDDADHERIFLQYQQAKQTDGAKRAKGTGLGLPISRTIVETHHGRIWAESAPGSGARFVVVLPIEGPGPIAPTTQPVETGEPGKQRFVEPLRVLVVDDDRQVGYALKGVLLSAGFTVDVACSADEALALAQKNRPQAHIVDMRMPNVDGEQLIEILRHDPSSRGAFIIAVSSPDQEARALKAGARAFLPKPIDGNRLVGTLAQLTSARREGARVLVVDDDDATRALCSEALTGLGYAVADAKSAAQAEAALHTFRPDLVLLDVLLPDGSGFDLIEGIKADRATSQTSVIFISARGDTRAKVRALQLGGDDYVVKPFDALELCARVETVLRRRSDVNASTTTMLPGSGAIDRAVSDRIAAKSAYTLCYADLDNFKAFNDYYGYAKADGVVHQTSDLMKSVVAEHGSADDFLGHIAGDDFVIICAPERAEKICKAVIEAFDRVIPLYYQRDDRERGYIEGEDRFGQKRKFPIMSISIVGVTDPGGKYKTHADVSAVAAALKKEAKAVTGSVYLSR